MERKFWRVLDGPAMRGFNWSQITTKTWDLSDVAEGRGGDLVIGNERAVWFRGTIEEIQRFCRTYAERSLIFVRDGPAGATHSVLAKLGAGDIEVIVQMRVWLVGDDRPRRGILTARNGWEGPPK